MSKFSGKCDLYDHIMMEKMTPSKDNPNILESDDFECFEIFKKRTGGVIYQSFKVDLDDYIAQEEAKTSKILTCEPYEEEIADKRCKNGKKTVKKYKYTFYGKPMTLAEINKFGYYTDKEIRFDDILDLVPYFPYIIGMCVSDTDHETVFISRHSYVDEQEENFIRHGLRSMADHYRKALKETYINYVRELDKKNCK